MNEPHTDEVLTIKLHWRRMFRRWWIILIGTLSAFLLMYFVSYNPENIKQYTSTGKYYIPLHCETQINSLTGLNEQVCIDDPPINLYKHLAFSDKVLNYIYLITAEFDRQIYEDTLEINIDSSSRIINVSYTNPYKHTSLKAINLWYESISQEINIEVFNNPILALEPDNDIINQDLITLIISTITAGIMLISMSLLLDDWKIKGRLI